jgi:hypothetical protein
MKPSLLNARLALGVALIAAAGAIASGQTRRGAPVLARTGVALTPANFPRHSPADVDQMFKLGKEVGSTAVFIYQWGQPDLVNVAKQMIESSRKAGLTPIVGLSPTVLSAKRDALDVPEAVRRAAGRKLSFGEKAVYEPYIRDVLELAKLKPPYLCLATEINMLALKDVKEYLRIAHVIKQVYPQIKKISPDTKVFVSFQWDILRMMDVKEPKKIKEWSKQIDVFRPELDVVAFTSYPAEVVGSPDKIPADYYERIFDHVKPGDEVMFMEIGWPTRGKGNEQSQVEFIRRLPALMAKVNPSVVAWSLLHDVRLAEFGDDLATTGLADTSGRAKPAMEAFKTIGSRAR